MKLLIKKICNPELLGWLGLTPFFLGLTLLFYGNNFKQIAQEIFLTYAAIILTFLGAVHWGVLISSDGEKFYHIKEKSIFYLWSISTSLIAWFGLLVYIFLKNYYLSSFIMLLGFLIALIIDFKFFNFIQWYQKLRLYLSIIVIVCIVISLIK